MAGEKELPSIHSQIGHYTGVLSALVNAHHTLRTSGECKEHGAATVATEPELVAALGATVTDVARLVSKLVVNVERENTPRVN